MKKIIVRLLVALVALLIVFAVVVAMQSPTFEVVRSTTISATPEAVFAHVNDFHQWDTWSPWAKLDPNAKNTFEGPAAGVGAVMRWAGNNEVGVGSMTITESRPSDLIRIRLDFTKPMEDTSTVEFKLQPQGNQTAVTWSIHGEKNFTAKAFGLLMNIEKMIGDKYEQGLASLKSVVESGKK